MKIKMSQTIYDIVQSNGALREALVTLGFKPMSQDATLNTVGRMMTLRKACDHLKLSDETVVDFFKKYDVEVDLDE